jgi:hypothetical protein
VNIPICLHFEKTIKVHQYGYPMKGQVTWHVTGWAGSRGQVGQGQVGTDRLSRSETAQVGMGQAVMGWAAKGRPAMSRQGHVW